MAWIVWGSFKFIEEQTSKNEVSDVKAISGNGFDWYHWSWR